MTVRAAKILSLLIFQIQRFRIDQICIDIIQFVLRNITSLINLIDFLCSFVVKKAFNVYMRVTNNYQAR